MEQRKGIDARRAERERKKAVLALQKRGAPVPIELLTPIVDPDVGRDVGQDVGQDGDGDGDGFIRFDTESEEEEEEEEDPFRDLIDPDLFN